MQDALGLRGFRSLWEDLDATTSPTLRVAQIALGQIDLQNKLLQGTASLKHLLSIGFQSISMTMTGLPSHYFNSSFDQTVTGEIFDHLEKAYETNDKEAMQKSLHRMKETFKENSNKHPKSLKNAQWLFTILISLIVFQVSTLQNKETELRLSKKHTQTSERLNQVEHDLKKLIALVLGKDDGKVFYVVKRPVNFRSKPHNKSTITSILYPNQQVERLKSKGKWIYVKYYDLNELIHKTGWVYKKYLKRQGNFN